MKRLVIFDLDGTLLNTIRDLGEACNFALSQHGYPTHAADEYPHFVGNGVNRLLWRALPESARTDETVLLLRQDFTRYYDDHNRIYTTPYEGIPELIQELRQKGITLAVASNKYQAATEVLVRHFFGDSFSVIRGEQTGTPRKPDPEIIHRILGTLSEPFSPHEILYVGDSDVDMQTARNAGLESVACSWGFCSLKQLQKEQPDHLINNPLDILKYIE